MGSTLDRLVVFVAIEGFALAVEIQKRPELAGSPVVIANMADPAKRGAVVEAASIEARARGVAPGMSLAKAVRAVPDLKVIEADYSARESASEALLTLLGSYTPLVESYAPGSAFMVVEPRPGRKPLDDAVEVAREVVESIRHRLGLPAVAGVGANKFTALVAHAATNAGGAVAVIPPDDAARALSGLSLGHVPCIDKRTRDRLEVLGARTLGDIKAMQARHLTSNFGRYMGGLLNDLAVGIDASPVVPFGEPGGVARELVLEEPTEEASVVRELVYALCEEVASILKAARSKCTGVSVKVGRADLRTVVIGEAVELPTDSMNDIWGAAKELVSGVEVHGRVRCVGVMATGVEGRD